MNQRTCKLLRAACAVTGTSYRAAKRAWLQERRPDRSTVREWLKNVALRGLAK